MDNLEKGHRPALRGSPLIEGDLRRRDDLEKVFRSHPIECVMHFAAYASVADSVQNPAAYYENNVAGCCSLLETMRAHQVDKFIFSSSAAVYGEPTIIPIPEDHPKNPTNPYGETKWVMERMLQWYGNAYGIRSLSLRYLRCRRCRPRRRPRRRSSSGRTPDSGGLAGRARLTGQTQNLRDGLAHAGRYLHPRLHPRQ